MVEDKWIRSKEDFSVDRNRIVGEVSNSLVCDFFLENTKTWDVDKLNYHFCREDVAAIVKTRIPQRYTLDRVAWTHSKDGKYTVKSGYFQWCQHHLIGDEIQQSRGWSVIWKLEIPHKTKVFLWRFCRNTLPVRIRLRSRGIAGSTWEFNIDSWNIEDSTEWLLQKLSSGSKEDLITISTVLSGIWFRRNKLIFENRVMTPEAVMEGSKNQIKEWQEANKRQRQITPEPGARQEDNSIWRPPELGCLKINVDAVVPVSQNWFALGMVGRNHMGKYMIGKTMKIAGEVSVVEAEMMGILEALTWASESTTGRVIIESDSLVSVQEVQHPKENLLEIGHIVQQCRDLKQGNDRLAVRFIRNKANRVAHYMAKMPCDVNSFCDFPSPPSHLLEILLSESSLN